MVIPTLNQLWGVRYPIIVAPMFLISNTQVILSTLNYGGNAAFPALNYRTEGELRVLRTLDTL
jgi:nitronate monooxygenase